MPLSTGPGSYWARLASLYSLLDSPFKPHEEDVRVIENAFGSWFQNHPEPSVRGLLLGATPGLALMRWPAGTTLIGADTSIDLMKSVWPGDKAGERFGICANWACLPLALRSVHLIAGDGSLNCVRHPEEARAVCRSVQKALTADGLFIVRCYIRPERPESLEDLFSALFGGAIPTFNQFKFRLFLALSEDTPRGIPVDEAYQAWAENTAAAARVAAATGWPIQEIETMEAYRGSSTVHTFPRLDEFRTLFDEFFEEIESMTLSYPLSEHCRIFVLRPRHGID